MHNLIMGERQHEVFREGVKQPEGHLVVMMLPVDRLARHIGERVMHPAHVPFEAEAEAAG